MADCVKSITEDKMDEHSCIVCIICHCFMMYDSSKSVSVYSVNSCVGHKEQNGEVRLFLRTANIACALVIMQILYTITQRTIQYIQTGV